MQSNKIEESFFCINDKKYAYILKRSDRKSLAILIKNGSIYVTAPMCTSMQSITNFLVKKISWIEKKLTISENKDIEQQSYDELTRFCFLGRELTPKFAKEISIHIVDDMIFLPNKPKLKLALVKFFKQKAKYYLEKQLALISHRINISFATLSYTNAKCKWGSCDNNGNIRLNWRLVFLPPQVIDYVIIHELCHVINYNHSRAFWNLVALYMPKYKICKKYLKDYSFFINLYR